MCEKFQSKIFIETTYTIVPLEILIITYNCYNLPTENNDDPSTRSRVDLTIEK